MSSDIVTWGCSKKMRRTTSEGGIGDRAVGPACAIHNIFHQDNGDGIGFEVWADKYKADKEFQVECNVAIEKQNKNDSSSIDFHAATVL